MKFISVKIKSLLVICAVAAVTGVFSQPAVREVFMSGNRNIPVYSVERDDTKIALTFNCAWNDSDIDEILSLLDKYNAKCTFFVVGEWAEKYPDALKKISEKGHEIGEHSFSHKDYTLLSYDEIKEDIAKTSDIISKITGFTPELVRVPSGSYNNNAVDSIEKCGFTPVQWSVDSIDYGKSSCEEIYERVTSKTTPGDIILMHNGTENTATALPRILDSLCGKYELVTVSELLYKDDFYVDNSGKMRKKF